MEYKSFSTGLIGMVLLLGCAPHIPSNHDKVVYEHETNTNLVCGNSEFLQTISIQSGLNSLNVVANVKLTYNDKIIQKNMMIVSISKSNADRIYFENHKIKLEVDGETISNLHLYFQKGNESGLLGKIDGYHDNKKFLYTFTKNSETINKEDVNKTVQQLPRKCGRYDIVYGNVDSDGVFKTVEGAVVHLLDDFDAKKYKGKKLLLSGRYWYQRGGLLTPDRSDANFSEDNLLETSVIQVVNGGFDKTLIESTCNLLKEKR